MADGINEIEEVLPEPELEKYLSLPPEGKARVTGIMGMGRQVYDCPKYNSTQDEMVMSNGNSWIVLGYDRTHKPPSGFGGKGHIRCSSVDIVAGRLGKEAKSHEKVGLDGVTEVVCDPNFTKDAARIYISQKAGVDGVHYFDLPAGTVGKVTRATPRSTIVLKADTLRFVARENIKFVTRTDKKNSQGGKQGAGSTKQYGIDLIGMNDSSDMQPMVKGDNLKACLIAMMANIATLSTRLTTALDYQRQINLALAFHVHNTSFYGLPSAPSISVAQKTAECIIHSALNVEVPLMALDNMNGKKGKEQGAALSTKYLQNPGGLKGKRYILSKYNNLN